MAPRLPWAQPGLNYGWGHGNEFFHPKTKEQIQEEALMQLAVLAVVLVAPALVGAGGGAGAGGSLGSGAGTVGGSLGSGGGIGGSVGAGMGTSAEAAGGMLTQAEAVSGLVDSTLMAAPMVPAAGAGAGAAAASGGGGALAGVLGAMQALQPFLQKDSARVLRSAAQKGPEHLNQELKRRTKDCDCPPKPKFVTEEWLRLHGDCGCDDKQGSDNGGLSSRDGRPHAGMEVLQGVMQLLRKDVGVSQALRQVDHCCSKPLSLDTQQKLRKTIGESLPLTGSGVKALEGVMDINRNRFVMDGPDEFSKSEEKANTTEILQNGKTVHYLSGRPEDIEKYQNI